MKKTGVLLTVLSLVIVTATAPGIVAADDPNFDPDDVTIATIEGEDPDQVNEISIDVHDEIHIALEGVDEFDRPLVVEIGGDVVTRMEEPDQEMKPRSGSSVSTGQQTLQIVYEDRGERTIVAETEVRVTDVILERDDDDGGLGFDPETIEIETVAGQDADRVNDIEIVENEEISLELTGVDGEDIYATVELDGVHVGSIVDGETSFRPRPGLDVSEGEQPLTLIRERDGDRIVLAETRVDVTHVDLTEDDPSDDPSGLDFDPETVSLATVNGEDVDGAEFALEYDEKISFSLDGLDVSEQAFRIDLGGATIGMVEESETAFRPRTDADVDPGERTLKILTHSGPGERTVVAETTVTVTDVTLDRESDRESRPEFDPETVSIVSVNGEPADQHNQLELTTNSPLSLELDGVEMPDRGFHVEIGGEVVGILEDTEGEIRIRWDSDVTTGEQTMQVVWKSTGNRTVLAETPVNVTTVDLDHRQFDDPPEDVDLEIVSVNGEPTDGVVVTEHDLRGETPIELTVDGLAETDREPTLRYDGETIPTGLEGYEVSGNQITLDHLPKVEDGAAEKLELVERTGPDDFHVYDSVEIEYRHVAGADASSDAHAGDEEAADEADEESGILNSLSKILGGDDTAESEETSDATRTEDDQQDEVTEDEPSDEDGGIVSTIRDVLGF
ncbi:hypothetical protein [Halanaeroarchaeum sulfurireducens]|uniref:Uncharacterized protein n=1 Tax=Halanaeroarchaeum sulfurireducens TaxID=1604004 RepID=A0A0F7PBT5_9EURY|nr:hypothetical protein [Halanaeroarchaeum sulfurireducens]AKH98152.1 hypothetical protein HLASF_1676 [Halanaeroarchaeum sulfurireducens]